ncbi:MAG: hypothetical protein ACFFAQ_01065 [Promethearchaeota archaeon]
MTEVKKQISYEFEEILSETKNDEIKRDLINQLSQIYTIPDDLDIIDKRRALKRWEKSLDYYYLHPEKFKFGFKDL